MRVNRLKIYDRGPLYGLGIRYLKSNGDINGYGIGNFESYAINVTLRVYKSKCKTIGYHDAW